MRKIVIGVFLLGLMCGMVRAGDTIVVMSTADVNDAVFSNMVTFARSNLPLVLKTGQRDFAMTTVSNAVNSISAVRTAEKAEAVVLVVDSPEDVMSEAIAVSAANQVGILNIRVVRERPDVKASRHPEVIERMLQKEFMRTTGLALGLQECPSPYCAMSAYAVMGDKMPGRNYCAPCVGIIEKKFPPTAGEGRLKSGAQKPAGAE